LDSRLRIRKRFDEIALEESQDEGDAVAHCIRVKGLFDERETLEGLDCPVADDGEEVFLVCSFVGEVCEESADVSTADLPHDELAFSGVVGDVEEEFRGLVVDEKVEHFTEVFHGFLREVFAVESEEDHVEKFRRLDDLLEHVLVGEDTAGKEGQGI
jgi:hypothetical protein